MAEVITFDPKYITDYAEMNKQWIRQYFVIEPMDIAQLEDPYGNILNHGGEIFFVVENDQAVGTCAMVPHGERCYELAKMAVLPSTRGKGYGDLLMVAAIEWARSKKAQKIILISNTTLTPAITLYKKYGFKTVSLEQNPDYARGNIEMHFDF